MGHIIHMENSSNNSKDEILIASQKGLYCVKKYGTSTFYNYSLTM